MLQSQLVKHSLESPLFITSNGKRFAVVHLLGVIRTETTLLQQAANKNIALLIDDDFTLSLYLILLDGVCKRLTLLPANADKVQTEKFITQSESEILFTDSSALNFSIATLPTLDTANLTGEPSLEKWRAGSGKCVDKVKVETQWVIATSGTTGEAKLVRHSLASLTHTTKSKSSTSNHFVWGLLYDVRRFAGLQVLLQCITAGSCLIFSDESVTLAQRLEHLVCHNCNALSATPTLWRKILMSLQASSLSLQQITLGGEIADDGILAALAAMYPRASIRHIYASTEAGVGFSVTDGKAGFPADYLTKPPKGIELAISEEGGLRIKSPSKSSGYLNSGQALQDHNGFVNTGDNVQKKGSRIVFLGRDSGVINVGGNKVQPEEVERVINAFSGVRLCSVNAKSNSITGSLVEAKVVVSATVKEPKVFIKALRSYCQQQLEGYKVPAFIQIVDDIEFNAAGKIKRP